eukprot:m.89417 g.89417  ORF g.89417 m.89417 type:complete len:59 (+) comp14577_c0_seq3:194-370(+)
MTCALYKPNKKQCNVKYFILQGTDIATTASAGQRLNISRNILVVFMAAFSLGYQTVVS